MHFWIRCWFLEFVLAKMNIYCSIKEQYSQAVIRTKYVQNKPYRAREEWIAQWTDLFQDTLYREAFWEFGQSDLSELWLYFFCSFGFKEPVMAQCLLFLKPITYLSFPSTDHCSLSSIFLLLANRSFVCWSMCLYCLH